MKIEEAKEINKNKLTLKKLKKFFKDNPDELFPLDCVKEKNIMDDLLQRQSPNPKRTILDYLRRWINEDEIAVIKINGMNYYQLPEVIGKLYED